MSEATEATQEPYIGGLNGVSTDGHDLAGEIIGTWISEVRQTRHGPMTFAFRIGADGTMEVTGTPASGSGVEMFRRSGLGAWGISR